MRILPINNNNQINSKAVNQKYYQWAERDFKRGIGISSEVFEQLRFEVTWGDIHPQDGIDTINKIIKDLLGKSDEGIEHILENFRRRLNCTK